MQTEQPEMMITLRDNARQELLKIRTVEEGISYLNKLKTIEVWVKAEKKDAELQNIVAEQKLRTQRILGELISENQRKGLVASQSNHGKGIQSSVAPSNTRTLSEIGLTREQSSTFKAIASIPEDVFEEEIQQRKQSVENAVNELTTAGMLRLTKNVHVSNNSGENEWYTPKYIIDKATEFFGTIDLDPASCEQANETVNASNFFTGDINGLNQPWFGKVWLNPPYSQPEISLFSDAVVNKREEYTELLLLVNNATETAWLQNVLNVCSAVCFIKSRVKFIDKNGNATGSPLQGQVIVYIGEDVKRFCDVFNELGVCMTKKP